MNLEGADSEQQGSREPVPSLTEYAERVTAERLEKLTSLAEDVRKNEETEPVHQMRVWSRRTRAALEIFEGCFPGKAFREIEREVKSITAALGEARDLDVMIENLGKRAEALPPTQRAGLESFVERLREKRAQGQTDVADAVTRFEAKDPRARFAAVAAKRTHARHTSRPGHGMEFHG